MEFIDSLKYVIPILCVVSVFVIYALRRIKPENTAAWFTIVGGTITIIIAYGTLIMSIPPQLQKIKNTQDSTGILLLSLRDSTVAQLQAMVGRTELLAKLWADQNPTEAKSIAKAEISKGVKALTKQQDISQTIEHFSLSASIQPLSDTATISKIDSVKSFLAIKDMEVTTLRSEGRSPEKVFVEIADTLLSPKYGDLFGEPDIKRLSSFKDGIIR